MTRQTPTFALSDVAHHTTTRHPILQVPYCYHIFITIVIIQISSAVILVTWLHSDIAKEHDLHKYVPLLSSNEARPDQGLGELETLIVRSI